MMKYIILGLALISFLVMSCIVSKTEKKSVKVMTWNIWHGGLHGNESSNFEKDSVNTVNVLKVLQEETPDVLLMQETYCCGMDIAKKAGYLYSWRGSSNLSIHSNYPIVDTIKLFKPFNSHGVTINVDGTMIMFVNIWLHYLPDYFQDIKTLSPDSLIAKEGTTRLKEITSILKAVDSLENEFNLPIVIGGDFNSGSHLDWIPSTKESHYNKVVQWPVSKLMKDHGFIDSFREANPDPTKTLDGTWGYLDKSIISDRIDFVYHKGSALKTKFSKIVQEDPKGGFFNSDHRAILSRLEIRN